MKFKTSLLALAIASIVQPPSTAFAQEEIEFDTGTLKARGLSKDVADYFKTGTRFSPGVNTVTLVVNGAPIGNTEVLFNAGGQPCYNQAFFERAGIKVPTQALDKASGGCLNTLQDIYPQATVQLLPGRSRIELLVPTDALAGPVAASGNYDRGGWAGLFNYDVLTMTTDANGNRNSVVQGTSDLGLNAGDWIVRSRQSFNSSSDGRNSFEHLYAYAQRSFLEQKQVLQAGELYASNSLFASPQFIGVQAFPEEALRNRSNTTGATVTGIARSQARVEVRQAGVLIYSTLVPAGPFSLSNLPLITSNADLQVTVVEQTGDSHSFVVPFAGFSGNFVPREAGWSAALGKIRNQSSDLQTDLLASVNGIMPLGGVANLAGGAQVSEKYRSAGVGLDGVLPLKMQGNAKALFSSDSRSDTNGVQMTGALSVPLTRRISATLSGTAQTSGYRDLTTVPTTSNDSSGPSTLDSRYRNQYTAGLGYGHETLGGLSVSYSRTSSFSGDNTQRFMGSWSKTFGNRLTVSASVERDLGFQSGTQVYVNLSIPLGGVQVGSNLQYASRDGSHDTRLGVTVDQQVNDYVGYNLSASTDTTSHDAGLSATLRLLPRYTSVSLGASSYGSDSRSYSASATGGVVLHKEGVSFTPYPVQDTLAVLTVPGVSGARINTPQGPVWTDWTGKAIAPYLPPYSEDRIELVTKSLPRNVDIRNGLYITTPGRGSVGNHTFTIVQNRRLLLHVRTPEGQFSPKGEAVVDGLGHYISTVGSEGTVFIGDEQLARRQLFVRSENNAVCELSFKIPDKAPEDAFYEELSATCQPVAALPMKEVLSTTLTGSEAKESVNSTTPAAALAASVAGARSASPAVPSNTTTPPVATDAIASLRRLHLLVRTPDGRYLAKGSVVLSAEGMDYSVVGDEGSVLWKVGQRLLYVRDAEGQTCRIALPDNTSGIVNKMDTVCQPVTLPDKVPGEAATPEKK